jgi:hypothetical protein
MQTGDNNIRFLLSCIHLLCNLQTLSTAHVFTAVWHPCVVLQWCVFVVHLQVLRSRTAAAEEAQWVQMERCSAGDDEASRASTTFAAGYDGRACRQHELQAATGAAGMQSRSFSPEATGEGLQDPQYAIELLRLCQRTVSGSLDDVVGLE